MLLQCRMAKVYTRSGFVLAQAGANFDMKCEHRTNTLQLGLWSLNVLSHSITPSWVTTPNFRDFHFCQRVRVFDPQITIEVVNGKAYAFPWRLRMGCMLPNQEIRSAITDRLFTSSLKAVALSPTHIKASANHGMVTKLFFTCGSDCQTTAWEFCFEK